MEVLNKDLTYYISTKTKLITLSLSVIFLICGVLMLIFKRDAPFYLDPFMESDFPYWGGLLILSFISLIIFISQLGEQRQEKYFLTEDGHFDLSTPRSYIKLERPRIIEFFSHNGINNFCYDGQGNVFIENGKGKKIQAPLSELKIKYWMKKNEVTGDFFINKMRVTDALGNKLSFSTNDSLMHSEFDDIHMILSNADQIEESKLSKADKWAYKLKGVVDDFDFTDIADSIAEIVVTQGVPAVSNSIINFVKTRLYKQTEKKTGFKKFLESLKKFFNNFLLVLMGLYLLMIIIVNVANLPVIFGGEKDDENNYYYNNNGIERYNEYNEPAVNEIQSLDVTLSGNISNRKVEMDLTFFSEIIENEQGMEYNVIGYLTMPYEAPLIGMLTDNYLNLDEYSDNVEYAYITEQFQGTLDKINDVLVYKGFILIEGDKYSFTLKSKNNNSQHKQDNKFEDIKILKGEIGSYPIEMEITFTSNESISNARYKYTKTGSGSWIDLNIDSDEDMIIMKEYFEGKPNGYFKGNFYQNGSELSYSGKFILPEKEYYFQVSN